MKRTAYYGEICEYIRNTTHSLASNYSIIPKGLDYEELASNLVDILNATLTNETETKILSLMEKLDGAERESFGIRQSIENLSIEKKTRLLRLKQEKETLQSNLLEIKKQLEGMEEGSLDKQISKLFRLEKAHYNMGAIHTLVESFYPISRNLGMIRDDITDTIVKSIRDVSKIHQKANRAFDKRMKIQSRMRSLIKTSSTTQKRLEKNSELSSLQEEEMQIRKALVHLTNLFEMKNPRGMAKTATAFVLNNAKARTIDTLRVAKNLTGYKQGPLFYHLQRFLVQRKIDRTKEITSQIQSMRQTEKDLRTKFEKIVEDLETRSVQSRLIEQSLSDAEQAGFDFERSRELLDSKLERLEELRAAQSGSHFSGR